jgi:hypothetical protein
MKRTARCIRWLSTTSAMLLLASLANPTQVQADDKTWYKARSIIILGVWCSGDCPIPTSWCCVILDNPT